MNVDSAPILAISHKTSVAGILTCCLLPALPLPGSAEPPLRMAFADEAIVVGQVEPGAEVLIFEVSRSVVSFVPRTQVRTELLLDSDKDGEVRIPLEGGLPAKFFAAAVERESGRFAILTPEGSPAPAREVAFPADAFGEGPGRRFDRLDDHGDLVALLLVRPGDAGGAWSLVTGERRTGPIPSTSRT